MGILSKIFGGKGEAAAAPSDAPIPECAHGALVPRWESAADMGKSDLISSYYCEGCSTEFSPAEAAAIRG